MAHRQVFSTLCATSKSQKQEVEILSEAVLSPVGTELQSPGLGGASLHRPHGTNPQALHALRHTFGSRRLLSDYDIRTVQELLGHKDVSIIITARRDNHFLNRVGSGVQSPADKH